MADVGLSELRCELSLRTQVEASQRMIDYLQSKSKIRILIAPEIKAGTQNFPWVHMNTKNFWEILAG